MLFVEGRTLGVIAALGVVLSMVAAFDRLSDVADSTEPHSPAAVTPASAAPMQALRHTAEGDGRTKRETQLSPAKPPSQLTPTKTAPERPSDQVPPYASS
jgi:hypothetical protein